MNLGMNELKKERNVSISGAFRYVLQIKMDACVILCKLYAELSEVFACGGQIVSDDGHILFNVHNNRSHIRTLVPNMLHTLPRHLRGRDKGQTAL